MSELAEYELPDGTTLQLSEEDVKHFPEAKKVASTMPKEQQREAPKEHQHEPVKNRARQN